MMNPDGHLLTEIFRCPNVRLCINLSDGESHPCKEIVELQRSDSVDTHDLPEPWMGRLEVAPILFIGSNPNAGADSAYPRWSDANDDVVDYFDNHFGGGRASWVEDGVRLMNPDGTKGRLVPYWRGVRRRAEELLERGVRPGIDYALTEVVHCKSSKQQGVTTASVQECGSRYFDRMLELSAAKVVFVMGQAAHRHVQMQLGVTVKQGEIRDEANRTFVFLHHPTAWKTEAEKSLFSLGSEAVKSLRLRLSSH